MTAAVIALGLALATVGVVSGLLLRSAYGRVDTMAEALIAEGKGRIAAESNMLTAARRRDEALGKADAAEQTAAAAMTQLAAAQKALNANAEELAKRVHDQALAGDALDVLNSVLAQQGDSGGAGSAAVPSRDAGRATTVSLARHAESDGSDGLEKP